MGHLSVIYDYLEDRDVTRAVCMGREVTIGIEPSANPAEFAYDVTMMPHHAAYRGFKLGFTDEGFDDFIAELQRCRSGCFDQKYPREVIDYSTSVPTAEVAPAGNTYVNQSFAFDLTPEGAAFFRKLFGYADEAGVDTELERLLAEEQEIEEASKARAAEAERLLAEEEEMIRRDALDEQAAANGYDAAWTARELVKWIKDNLTPNDHVGIVQEANGVYALTALKH